MYSLDKKDRAILNELQEDCRQSTRDLGKKLKMPATTVHQRIKRLAERGVIKSFSAILDPEKVGLPSTAFILVKRNIKKKGGLSIRHENVGDSIAKLPEAEEVFLVSGEHDVIVKVRGKDERDIAKWVVDTLWNIPEVERTDTLFVFHKSKESHKLNTKQSLI